MGMIGNQTTPGVQFAITNDSYNGDGSTTAFTLSQSVSATTDIEVIVDNVQQSPHDGSYSVSGTALTFSGAPSAGTNNIYVIYHGSKHHTTAQVIPDAGSVDHSKMHTNATLPITRDMTNNRVGINHTSPEQHLHISSSTNTRALIETTNAGSVAELQLKNTAQTVKLGIETSSDAGGGAYGNASASGFVIQYGSNAGIVVDTNGYTRMPQAPNVRLSLSSHFGSGNTIPSGPGSQVNTFNVEENVGNHWDNSTNLFTCPVDGVYAVSIFYIKYPAAGAAHVDLHKNGAYIPHIRWRAPEGTSSYEQAGGTVYVTCSANDTLDWHYFGAPGMHTNNGAWSIRFVG